MKLLARIIARTVIVRTELARGEEFRTEVLTLRGESLVQGGWEQAKTSPVLVIVCGHGIVSKPDHAEITSRIKADPATFLWSSSEGTTSFVRRERLRKLDEELAVRGIVPVQTFCIDTEADFGTEAAKFENRFTENLKWKALLKPTAENSAILQILIRRTALPILSVFLCLLAANALIAPKFNALRQSLQTEADVRERTHSENFSTGKRQQRLLAEFEARSSFPRAVVCDRIGRAVPQHVVLTELAIEPLTKRFEAREPLQRRENTAVICGTAAAAADVSAFVQRLSETTFCRRIRLTHVEKERDGDRLSFRIETAL